MVWPWIEAGHLKPIIEHAFPLAEAGRAHALMDSPSHMGKVMLTI